MPRQPFINEGFFVINQAAFVQDALKRHGTVHPEVMELAREIKYIVPQGFIMVDADSSEAVIKVDKLIERLQLNPFQYNTSEDHKHYGFRTDETTQKLIDDFNLHSSSHKLALDNDIDTRSFNTKTSKTGAVYLKKDGKDKSGRPSPEKLLEGLKTTTDVVPLFLLMPKIIGFIPQSGANGNNTALPIMGKLKYYDMTLESIDKLFSQAATYHEDKHVPADIIHKYKDARELQIESQYFSGKKPEIDPATLAQFHYNKYLEFTKQLAKKKPKDMTKEQEMVRNYISELDKDRVVSEYGFNITMTKLYCDFMSGCYCNKETNKIPSKTIFKKFFESFTGVPTSVKPRGVNRKKARGIDLTPVIELNKARSIGK